MTRREAYLAAGKCPAISSTKAWCNDDKGHARREHRAQYDHPGSRVESLYWTDEDPYPRPL